MARRQEQDIGHNRAIVVKQTGLERQAELIATLLFQIKALGLPMPERERTFALGRRWRFDLAWREKKVACEIEGGTWMPEGGRHNRGAGFEGDCVKHAEAACLGWIVIRVTPVQIEDGRAIGWLERLLKGERCSGT